MFRFVYLVWGIIPFIFISFIIVELLKRAAGQKGRSHMRDYGTQLFYTSIALALAVLSDLYFFHDVIGPFFWGQEDAAILSWMQYPFILLGMLQISRYLAKRKESRGSKRKGTMTFRP